MPRQKRSTHKTPLAEFLRKLIKDQNISILQAARIALRHLQRFLSGGFA